MKKLTALALVLTALGLAGALRAAPQSGRVTASCCDGGACCPGACCASE